MSQESDPNTDVERVDLQSLDVAEQTRQELLRLFPEVRTEGGKIDFDRLKLTLGAIVDVGKERYGLTWPGKAECFRTIQRPSTATLRPMREDSVNFETTENLIIEGDNLEVLKLLQKAYLGKVKMIYIDPPYNTGNDFIYPDNYTESLQTYLEYTGQVDSEGKKFSTNTEADGRFHSKWLNMMYPRLYLARNLLRQDGSIFISINDVEIDNLRRLCDEVFGEENRVATVVWQKSKRGDSKLIAITHEYILVYARDKRALIESGSWRQKKPGVDEVLAKYDSLVEALGTNHDQIGAAMRAWYASLAKGDARRSHAHYRWSDSRGLYFAADFAGPDDGRESRPRYDIPHPVTGKPCKKPSTGWRWEEERTRAALAASPPYIHFGPDETTIPCRKTYLKDLAAEPFASVLYRDGRAATLELEKLLEPGLFDFPKDRFVLADLITLASGKDDLILDFFAGSGTTAHAVIESNREWRSSRRFILVQLPEPTHNERYPSISVATRARVRRVLDGPTSSDNSGFRAFVLAESNLLAWNADTATSGGEIETQLSLHVHHLRSGRTDEDLLFEILLKEGFPPTTRNETVKVATEDAQSLADGALIICLSRKLDLESVRAIADRKPERVVCLDEGFFGNDQLKANAVQIFKTKGIVFRTI